LEREKKDRQTPMDLHKEARRRGLIDDGDGPVGAIGPNGLGLGRDG